MIEAAVADTHALLLHAAGGKHLGKRAAAVFAAAERHQSIIYIPSGAIWECTILVRIGRIDLKRPPRIFFEDLFSNPAYQPVDLTPEQVFLADDLRLNTDPFDALICAAARHLDLPLLTRDAEIQDSGVVRAIW